MVPFGNRKQLFPDDLLPLEPKTDNQERYLEALYSDIPIVIGSGFAGTGKTSLSYHSALSQVFEPSSPYDKVVIVRNIVESSNSIGFLPGGIEEKIDPYLAPYKALSQDFLNFNEPWKLLNDLGNVEFVVANYIRGITLDRSIIIIDEAQNFPYATLKDIITRAGYYTKIVINGDVGQSDLAKVGQQTGLGKLTDVLRLMPYGDVAEIEFGLNDIVRSGICKNFLISDYDYHKNT